MKRIISKIYNSFSSLVRGLCDFYSTTGGYVNKMKVEIVNKTPDGKRFLLLCISALLFADYLMVSVHVEKNIFDLFPEIPILDEKRDVSIFLPDPMNGGIIEEKHSIGKYETDEAKTVFLFNRVLRGSKYENTSSVVPADMVVRNVWIQKSGSEAGCCTIDLNVTRLKQGSVVIPGSEKLFREALHKTIAANITGVKKTMVLEHGNPAAVLWEF